MNIYEVSCPFCKAPEGELCRDTSGFGLKNIAPHTTRIRMATGNYLNTFADLCDKCKKELPYNPQRVCECVK